MRKYPRHLVLILSVLIIGVQDVSGGADCITPLPSIITYPEISKSSVLLVEVSGKTHAVTNIKRFKGKAIGLKAKVLDSINTVSVKNSEVELFQFVTEWECSDFAGVSWQLDRGSKILIFGKNNKHFFLDEESDLSTKYEFGGIAWEPKFRVVGPHFELADLENFDYRGKSRFDAITNSALVRDSKQLSTFERNSQNRKDILNRLFHLEMINFPTFVDTSCPHYPACGLRPWAKGSKPMYWLEKWERRLIIRWNKHQQRKTVKISE